MPRLKQHRKPALLPPQRLGDFHIGNPVVCGRKTLVYRALRGRQMFAIRVLKPELSRRKQELLKFYDDAKVGMQFDHPHLLPILEVNQCDGWHYSVSPWITHGSLRDVIHRQGPLWEAQAIQIAGKVWEGLDEVRSRMQFHGRLKASNVLIDERFSPQISGLSRLPLDPASPRDQRDHQNRIDETDRDEIALAELLYFMLTGLSPFGARSITRTGWRPTVKSHELLRCLPSETSPQVKETLAICLCNAQPSRQPAHTEDSMTSSYSASRKTASAGQWAQGAAAALMVLFSMR